MLQKVLEEVQWCADIEQFTQLTLADEQVTEAACAAADDAAAQVLMAVQNRPVQYFDCQGRLCTTLLAPHREDTAATFATVVAAALHSPSESSGGYSDPMDSDDDSTLIPWL